MRIPIRYKLVTSYFFISAFTALLIFFLIDLTSEQRINLLAKKSQTREMSQEISHWYAAEQGWDGFSAYFQRLHPPPELRKAQKLNNNDATALAIEKKKLHGLVDANNIALLNYAEFTEGETIPKTYLINAIPIRYKGEVIAKIIPPDEIGLSLSSELRVFLKNIGEVLTIAIVIGVFISFLMGLVLARIILKPVELLTQASKRIAKGELKQKVVAEGNDEISDLAQSFNKMSEDLAIADKQRRQLTADITHDLGTPIQVISGYIEMAQEGVLELNQERIDTVAEELKRVNRLIEDMSLLAKTDAKTLSLQLAPTNIKPVLQRVVRLYENACNEKNITLSMQCRDAIPTQHLDEERIVQVLGNLISNALRYTPQNGEIKLAAQVKEGCLLLQVIDTGCGIAKQDLPFIFDRFYRSDSARSGTSGKMGLGLSISQGLIEMHGGTISVDSDGVNGSCFEICLPIK